MKWCRFCMRIRIRGVRVVHVGERIEYYMDELQVWRNKGWWIIWGRNWSRREEIDAIITSSREVVRDTEFLVGGDFGWSALLFLISSGSYFSFHKADHCIQLGCNLCSSVKWLGGVKLRNEFTIFATLQLKRLIWKLNFRSLSCACPWVQLSEYVDLKIHLCWCWTVIVVAVIRHWKIDLTHQTPPARRWWAVQDIFAMTQLKVNTPWT